MTPQLAGIWCGNCYDAKADQLNLPRQSPIPLGIFAGGCSLVAAIQALRFYNGGRYGRGRRTMLPVAPVKALPHVR